MEYDRSKTLEQLDGVHWHEPDYDSHLVATIYVLRKKPLKDFTVEDLRICIGQHFFDEYLIPLAIEELERNPLVMGDYYPGDLLKNVIEATESYWSNYPEYCKRINSIAKNAINRLKSSRAQVKLKLELIEELETNRVRILQIRQHKIE